ncbi:hypothetical protein Sjap_020921 [Stephania japonica]|uniref:ATG8-interacting protein 1 n=1 Tax=Stephania japonica TaxID=461633 RepID=A0AAP0F763_9MAGN
MDDEKEVANTEVENTEVENAEVENTPTRGNEWEVVSLTASTYAAAPGPKSSEPSDSDHGDEPIRDDEGHRKDEDSRKDDEVARALFMSGHFAFPPNEHENLPIELDASEICNEPTSDDVNLSMESGSEPEQGDKSGKSNEESFNIEEMIGPEDLHEIPFFVDKGKRIFETHKVLHGLSLVGEEHIQFSSDKFDSFHEGEGISGSNIHIENLMIPDLSTPRQLKTDSSPDLSKSPSPRKGDDYDGSGLPCEAWWKRRVASLYAQAKEANAFWSVFVAAALMGLVIIGQRWQQERWQMQQLKWQFSVRDEKMNWMLTPISRLKEAMAGGHRRGSVIRSSASAER